MDKTQFYYQVSERYVRPSGYIGVVYYLIWFDPNFHLGPQIRGQVFHTSGTEFDKRREQEGWKPYNEEAKNELRALVDAHKADTAPRGGSNHS